VKTPETTCLETDLGMNLLNSPFLVFCSALGLCMGLCW